jgi:hypothetical protein
MVVSRRASPPSKTRPSAYEKLAITLPRGLADSARAEAKATGAGSFSAFIATAVEEKLERDRLREALDEVFRDEPMTEAEREWADKLLGL